MRVGETQLALTARRADSPMKQKRLILLGNKPDWRVSDGVDKSRFRIVDAELNAETIELTDIDAVLPFDIKEYELIRKSRHARKKSVVPTPMNVVLANDKLRFNRWLASTEFVSCLPKLIERIPTFPLTRKKRIDFWGLNTSILRSLDELTASNIDLEDSDYFLQEYVYGKEEFSTHTISVGGSIVYCSTNKHIYGRTFYVKGQEQPIGVDDLGGLIPPEIEGILKLMNYTGCACFNYKMVSGIPAVFEMNPRVGGSFLRVTNDYIEGYLEAVERLATPKPQRKGAIKWPPLSPENIQQSLSTQSYWRRYSRALLRRLRLALWFGEFGITTKA